MANPIVQRLTNKVGPLPAWAWAAIPATAYVAWSYYRASQGGGVISDEPAATESPVDEYGINTGGAFLPGYGSAPGGSSNLPPVDSPRPDNGTWFRQASTYLISEGTNPSDVVTALNAYLHGFPQTINRTQMNALQKALIYLGAPPEPAFMPTVNDGGSTGGGALPSTVLQLRIGSYVKGIISATWSPPSQGNPTSYQWSLFQQGSTPIRNGATVGRQIEIPGLQSGVLYTVQVKGKNAKGLSPTAASGTVKVK